MFKKGEILICVGDRDIHQLTAGKEYTALDDEQYGIVPGRHYITVESDDGKLNCHASRFISKINKQTTTN